MKKRVSVWVVVVAVCCLLTACNFTTNFNDSIGITQMEAFPQVEKMISALAEQDMDGALELVHPDRKADAQEVLKQVADFLAGRKVTEMEQTNLSVKNTSSNQGNTRQENGTLSVVLEDGERLYLSVCYVTQENVEGFYTFQLVLGLV